MPFKWKSWKLQEAQAEERRHDILSQQSVDDRNKQKAAGNLEAKKNWQREQQLKTDKERAEKRTRDRNEAQRKEERERKKAMSKYYEDKERAERNVGRQTAVGITEHRYRGESNLRPQPARVKRARIQTEEEKRALGRKQAKDMGIYGQH